MDAMTLFRQGVVALRDHKDPAAGRRLLLESLKLDPRNDKAWVWLAETTTDTNRKMQCAERALNINPENVEAMRLKAHLEGAAVNGKKPKIKRPPSSIEHQQMARMMREAEHLLELDDTEGAIEQWVNVLGIQSDHPDALKYAVKYLVKLTYDADARELLERAIAGGTTTPSVYMTAIDLAKRGHDMMHADRLTVAMIQRTDFPEDQIIKIIDKYVKTNRVDRAITTCEVALEKYPDNQPLLLKLAELHEDYGRKDTALMHYEKAVKLGANTKAGREADKKLANYVPVVTDVERGSVALAWRETAGIGLTYLLLGWMDCGLNLLSMGITRWIGMVLAITGGYLLVTATSSPQQKPIANWLGGQLPRKKKRQDLVANVENGIIEEPTNLPIIPDAIRIGMGVGGGVLLVIAFVMVFGTALHLLFDPAPVYFMSFEEFLVTLE